MTNDLGTSCLNRVEAFNGAITINDASLIVANTPDNFHSSNSDVTPYTIEYEDNSNN